MLSEQGSIARFVSLGILGHPCSYRGVRDAAVYRAVSVVNVVELYCLCLSDELVVLP